MPWQGFGRVPFLSRRPAIKPGDTWGVGHGTSDGQSTSRLTRVDGSWIWITSRVTGHRPTGLVDCRDGSAYHEFISVLIALRYRGAIARLRGSRGPRPTVASGRATAPLSARANAPGDAAPIEVRLDHPRRRDQVRVVADRAGHPVDVGGLEGRDLAERVAVELAELDDRRLGLVERRAPAAGGSGEAGRERAVRSAWTRAAARGAPDRCATAAGRAGSCAWLALPVAWLRAR